MNNDDKKYAGRPPRLSRVFDPSPLYFVTFNTWQRTALLAHEAVHNAFSAYAEKNLPRGFAMGRYVIMPDHVHFFIRIGFEQKLDQYVRLMKQNISRVLRTDSSIGKIWQPGFFDHVMRSSESYSEKWHYVRMNPVRAGLVDHPDKWRFQGEVVKIFFD